MARIEDFEKRYVNTVVFNEGDTILVTEENIEDLRNILKIQIFVDVLVTISPNAHHLKSIKLSY